tara:strand:- start:1024 stop:1401 length:378 start_codon:yes stop_codon:yes gene_type:complete
MNNNSENDKKWKRSVALATAQKKYYEKNKDKLIEDQIKYNKEYVKKDIQCECGANYKRASKYLHMRSAKHERRMEKIKNGEDPNICKSMTKVPCDCGSLILKRNQKVHEQSTKHKKYVEEECIIN